jgi:hypothetical protein
MNKKQRLVLVIGILVCLVMGLFPPWKGYFTGRYNADTGNVERVFAGYAFLLSPPTQIDRTGLRTEIDLAVLIIQWVFVLGLCGLAALALAERAEKETS